MPSRRRNWQQADSTEWVKILRGRPPSVHRVRWNVRARASERSLKDHQGGRVVSRACREEVSERRFQHSPRGGSSQGSWHATSPSPRGIGGWAGPFGVWRHCAPRARPVSGCIHTPCLEEGQIRELISPACSRWSTSCKRSEVRSRRGCRSKKGVQQGGRDVDPRSSAQCWQTRSVEVEQVRFARSSRG